MRTKVKTSFTLPPDVIDYIKEQAEEYGLSASQWLAVHIKDEQKKGQRKAGRRKKDTPKESVKDTPKENLLDFKEFDESYY